MTAAQGIARHAGRVLLGARVGVLFAVVELGLRTTTLPVLCRRLGIVLGGPGLAREPGTLLTQARAVQLVRAVNGVGPRWPLGDTCLRRCLVLGRLLRATSPTLVLGVQRTADGSIAAHSWLEVGGRSIDPLSAAYATLPL